MQIHDGFLEMLVIILLRCVAGRSFDHGFRLRGDGGGEKYAFGDRCFAPKKAPERVIRYCAPSFLIIGFGRCGTTSLSKYLAHHPRLSFGTRKEHFYFYRPEFCDLQHGENDREACRLEQYASQFPVVRSAPRKNVTFDATPMLGGDMGVPASERTMGWLRSNLPHLKLVVLVKSPADRFMSNPLATAKITRLQESLLTGENVMPQKLKQLLMDNCYVEKLEAWLGHFPPDRFLLVRSEDLRGPLSRRQSILDDVHRFLGVEPFRYDAEHLDQLENFHRASNVTLLPAARAVINCLPRLKACEQRLEDAVDFPTSVFDWCRDAQEQVDALPRLRSSRPPIAKPTMPPVVRCFGGHCAPSFLLLSLAGRSSGDLASALSNHPALTTSRHDVFYFSDACDLQRQPDLACRLEDYAAGFDGRLTFDATFDATAPPVIDWYQRHLPDLRFVVVAKSPAERFASNPSVTPSVVARVQRIVEQRNGRLPMKVELAVHKASCYVDKLQPWLDKFHSSRFLFVDAGRRQSAFDEIHDFLGLPPHVYPDTVGGNTSAVPPSVRAAIDCHPTLRHCQARLNQALQSNILWCLK